MQRHINGLLFHVATNLPPDISSLVSSYSCDLPHLPVITTVALLPVPRCPGVSGLRHLLSNPLLFLCLLWVEEREGGVANTQRQ